MVSYFCYFGDSQIGAYFKKLIFQEGKLNILFSGNLNNEKYGKFLKKILIRIFIDGEKEQYPQISDRSIFFSKKDKCIISNFHLLIDEVKKMDEEKTNKYIVDQTLYSIYVSFEKIQALDQIFKAEELINDVANLFNQKGFVI